MKPLHIYDKTFKQNYYVYYGVKFKDFVESVKKMCTSYEPDKEDLHREGKCELLIIKDVKIVLLWTLRKDIQVLAHEACHAAYFTLKHRGINITDDSEEIMAYLIERIVRETLNSKR